MLVLGLNTHHADAAAALYHDGQLVAAIAEERLNRVKHCAGFPNLAVPEVLRIAGADVADLDSLVVARDSRANLRTRIKWTTRNLHRSAQAVATRVKERVRTRGIEHLVADACGQPRSRLRSVTNHVEHHFAHAASAFLPSPFERAAILTMDGFGDFSSSLMGYGQGRDIRVLSRVSFPHSLGILYTAVSQFIGFDRYGDEGKVMGLASYGEPEFADAFERLLRLTPDGFELDLGCFSHHTSGVAMDAHTAGTPHVGRLYTDAMARLFGPPRRPGTELTARERNIASSLQLRLEQAVLHLAGILHRALAAQGTPTDALCLAGGVALNGVANGRLLRESPFRRLYVQPAAGDDGTALGAAAWVCARDGFERHEMRHTYWGPSYSDAEIEQCLRERGMHATRLEDADLYAETARQIASGSVVGWFQGAMEWGPRALGNRSILAHPGHPEMQDILNARIKHREAFRPFAPSIKAERVGDYFDCDHESPFMLHVYNTRPERRAELRAVNHVDNTGRVQTVTAQQNPRYYRLLDAFEAATGTPVLLNTSFNENEPIVCRPQEALDCFLRTRMDALVMGNFMVRREDAPVATETESYAASVR